MHKPIESSPTMSSVYLNYLKHHLLSSGQDTRAIFAEAGAQAAYETGDVGLVTMETVSAIFEVAASKTEDPCFGLHMAGQFNFAVSSVVLLAMMAAPTVEEGLKTLVRHQRRVDSGITSELTLDNDCSAWAFRVVASDDEEHEQFNEFLLALIFGALKTATFGKVRVREVYLKHGSTKPPVELEEHFGARVRFREDDNRLVFDNEYLQEPFGTGNSILHSILTNALNTLHSSDQGSQTLRAQVYREVLDQLRLGKPTLKNVAAKFSVSDRELRRALSKEGTNFQDIKSEALETLAKYYLSDTDLALKEVANILGFSETSSFVRAFRSWSGDTPLHYRQEQGVS